MNQMSLRLAERMVDYDLIGSDDIAFYAYSIQLFLEATVFILAIFTIAAVLGCVFEIVSFLAVFMLIRKFSDGFHCKSSLGCFIVSVLCTLSTIIMVPLLSRYYAAFLCIVVLSTLYLLVIGTHCNPEVCYKPGEISRLKELSRITVVIVGVVVSILLWFRLLEPYNGYFATGVIYNGLSVSIARIINKKGGNNYEKDTI